jgi:hypothetical protein
MYTFFPQTDYAGISIRVDATEETVPGSNIAVLVWINCTATGVKVDHLDLDIYGFKNSQEKIQLDAHILLDNETLAFNETREFDYVVPVPADVWGTTYADLSLDYLISGDSFERNPSFSTTNVRNIYYEKLTEDFKNLNQSYNQLNASYLQLNSTYWQLNSSYAQLNQSYWQLYQNYTSLQGSTGELGGTRTAVAILAITTVFFVATTAYLVFRKPKESW